MHDLVNEVDPDLTVPSRNASDSPAPLPKERVTIIPDSDVAQHFRSSGTGWEARLNGTLRDAVFGAGSRG